MRFCLIFFLFLAINHFFIGAESESSHLETYIVHVEPPNGRREMADLETYYLSFLPTTLSARDDEEVPRILFSYQHVFFGFAARLSDEDVTQMERKRGFISAEKEEIFQLDTTYTPNFLGLNRNTGFWQQSNYGRGVIIGVLDTGINPVHPSFDDTGIPTPPARWRGQCQFTSGRCNNKLIGARSYVGGPEPFDESGHGSHVAGIAAGNYVNGANVNGNAAGTASGIAPLAHLAVYKVCGPGCSESAIVAGMDAAIGDGVDILSISLGSPSRPFHRHNLAIGAFAAVERGIFVSCSGGNRGPSLASLSNEAPWVLTVGASTTDRQIRPTLVLGNNKTFVQGTVFGDLRAPAVASFSSRGPNQESNGILKPDILGPGVQILSASHNTRGFVFNSGTSMACPHLSGVAALLKSRHPNWSPAAIKSAIITTADIVNRGNTPIVDHLNQPATLFARGAGQVNPTRSNNPGLIYDLASQDYIPFLCGLGYTLQQIQVIVRRNVDCRVSTHQAQLNYPSFSIIFGPRTRIQTYTRTVTNVGVASSIYTARVEQSPGLQITVNPPTLRFTSLNQRIEYQVTFRHGNHMVTNESVHQGSLKNNIPLYQGSIIWTSGTQSMRTPVVAIFSPTGGLSTSVMDAGELLPSM